MSNELEQIISFDDTNVDYSALQDQNINLPTESTPPADDVTPPTPPVDTIDDNDDDEINDIINSTPKLTDVPEPESTPEPESVDNTTTDSTSDDGTEQIKAYYEFLVENNILHPNQDFEFKNDSDSLQEAFQQTQENLRQTIAQQMFDALPEEFKPIIQYGFSGGKNVKEFLDTYTQAPPDLSQVDLDNEDNQRAIVREYYRHTTRLNPDKVEKLIDSLAQRGDLETEAYDAATALKDIQATQKQALIEQARLQAESEAEMARKTREELLNTIDNSDFIPSNRKNKVKGFMFSETNSQPKMDAVLSNIFANREHVVQLADILIDSYDPKKGFILEDRYTKKAASKALNDFQTKIQDKFSDIKVKTKGGSNIDVTKQAPASFEWMFTDPNSSN